MISRFRPRNSGDSRDARTAPETALQEQPTEYLMSENEKRLIQSLRDALSEMLSELRDNYFEDSREKYAIRATDQLREEIMNFTMSVDEYYRDRWVSVFEFLYRCHAILNEELAAEEKLSLQRMEVLSQMNKYLEIRE